MRNRVKATSPVAVAIAAAAVLSTSVTSAQSGDDTLWLECRETSRDEDTHSAGFANDVFAVRANSIVSYKRQANGDLDRWGDLCEQESPTCRINEDEIFARFSVPSGEYVFSVNRRTGLLFLNKFTDDVAESFWGQCSRTTDPRPPAAF
jgi:hypothetical protein